jgi:hypothetical protein
MASSSFDDDRCRVEAMLDAGEPMTLVEQEIDQADLAPETRDALWLLAWSRIDLPQSGIRVPTPEARLILAGSSSDER